jgi:hypothetical protein
MAVVLGYSGMFVIAALLSLAGGLLTLTGVGAKVVPQTGSATGA